MDEIRIALISENNQYKMPLDYLIEMLEENRLRILDLMNDDRIVSKINKLGLLSDTKKIIHEVAEYLLRGDKEKIINKIIEEHNVNWSVSEWFVNEVLNKLKEKGIISEGQSIFTKFEMNEAELNEFIENFDIEKILED